MMRQRVSIGYYIAEGVRGIFSHGLMSFSAICMIVACLIIMGSFSMVALNAERMLGQLESENEFLVYIDETYTDEQIEVLREEVESIHNVSTVTFIAKEEAKAAYLEGHTGGLYESLPDEVFRDRFSVHVADLEKFEKTVHEVADLPGIVNYRAESDIAKGFVMVRDVATVLAYILVALLAVVSLFIISNTIRLATFIRRNEIAIMKMCGATNWFIRWPFVFEGLIIGVVGAAVAFGLQWGVYAAIYGAVMEGGAMTLFPLIRFETVALKVLCVFLGAGAVIGAGGSGLAIRKFLKV